MARVKKLASHDEEERIDSPIKPVQSSSDDFDSDSDDIADSEDKTQASPMTSAFTIKPRDDVDTATTSKRKLTTTTTTTTPTAKKSKKSAATNTKQPQRIWMEDDEISLLKGMVEYKKEKGTEPSGTVFFDFIKNYLNLNFELSRSQLVDKTYRLRKKYEANVEKAGYGEPVFDKPHDRNVFELSKEIWCRDAGFDYVAAAKKMTSAKGKVSETKKDKSSTSTTPLTALSREAGGGGVKDKVFKGKKDKVVEGNCKSKADVEINDKVDGNDVGEKVKDNIWSEMFLSSVVDVSKEPELPEFWDSFIKKRISKGDDTAKLLQGNELELKLKKTEIQRKQHELELAQFRASQS